MIKFGPSGVGDLFGLEGLSKTIEVPKWLNNKGMDCYEYSFGKGVRIGEETANLYGAEFTKYNIEISVHAPYFINMATVEEDKAINNHRYIFESIQALKQLGGKRCVFHPGSPLKNDRQESMGILMNRMEKLLLEIYANKHNDIILAVETMGKAAQLGSVEEIIEICNLDNMLYPCIDFGHVNARSCGLIKGYDDYARLLEQFINGVGYDKINNMHVHFSKIQYTAKGEFKHLTFEDQIFGPEYEPLAQALLDFNINPYIICESSGTQTVDSMYMKSYYNSLKS